MPVLCLLALTFRNRPNLWKHSDFWTILSGIVDKSEGQAATQRYVHMLKKWVNGKAMRSTRPRPAPRSCIWVGRIPSINTGWGMSESKPVLLRRTWGFCWRRSWRRACNVYSHNWIMVQGGKFDFFFSADFQVAHVSYWTPSCQAKWEEFSLWFRKVKN